jgi:hypothetical protein
MKKMLLIKFLILTVIICTSTCSKFRQPTSSRVRFAVTGNTYPASPFTGFKTKLEKVIQFINKDNPVLVFHTGNVIHGGSSWMGLRESDITRQYRIFQTKSSNVAAIFYPIAGEKDLFNDSMKYFTHSTGKKVCYSVNYGSIHFSLASLIKTKNKTVEDQLKWLEDDLKRHSRYSAIFIITHSPIYTKSRKKIINRMDTDIHSMLKKYPVKAVISGGEKSYSQFEKDGIQYIIAGTGGFFKEERYYRYNQYYIINYSGVSVHVEHKKIK